MMQGQEREKELEYYAPGSLEEAERLKQQAKGYHYLAGGTILNWKGEPGGKGVIDLKHLQLDHIEVMASKIVLGAMSTIQAIADSPKLPKTLQQAARLFSSRNIRNIATIGGTVTDNFFVSDVLPILAALQAEIEYFQDSHKQVLPLSHWLQTKPGLICGIIAQQLQRTVKFRQAKIANIDFPLIVTAIGCDLVDNSIKEPVVAISGASNKLVISASGAEYLHGKRLADIDADALNQAVQQDVEPTSSIKATARVKRGIIADHLHSLIPEFQQEERS